MKRLLALIPTVCVVIVCGVAFWVVATGTSNETTPRPGTTLVSDGAREQTPRPSASGVPSEDVRRILPEVEAAFRSAAWRDLYAILAEDLREETSAAELETSLNEQTSVLGPITDLRRLTVADPRVSPLGFTYVVATYSVTRRPASGPTSSTYDLYLVHEAGTWKLLFSAPR